MNIEDQTFEKIRINSDKLADAGFVKAGNSYVYETDFCEGMFHAVLTIDSPNRLTGKVIEKETGEEYLPLRVPSASGEFVYHVRNEYTALLKSIALRIGTPVPFQSDQANRIVLKITERYGNAPDFPWRDSSDDSVSVSGKAEYSDYGVFRHPDTEKWYGLLMYTAETNLKTEQEKAAEKKKAEKEKELLAEERKVREEARKAGKKLPPLKRSRKRKVDPEKVRKINILNLKIRPEDRERLLQEKGIYPSFHMNQKRWISIRLDDSLPDEQIMKLVENSWQLTGKGGSRHQRSDGRKVWIVPANPKYYDIVGVFSQTDDTIWKQGKGIQTGDIVYMYVAVPYSAILYRCTVTQAHSASENGVELMDIHIDERYDRSLCTLEKMKQFHVTTVRGPRFMPEKLEQFIQEQLSGSTGGK